jgi:hypothetical protein
MALPTYLELVNDILVRMREPEVSTVQENTLSKLIGKLVNDAKRQVEDAYKWSALITDIPLTTVADTSTYAITGSGSRYKVSELHNTTKYVGLKTVSLAMYNLWSGSSGAPQIGSPNYYCFNGIDTNGDAKVMFWPVPDAAYNINVQLYVPQNALSADSDTMKVPDEPVILGAFARALVERGEDGGLNSSEAYGLYKASLADAIAIESSRFVEEDAWEAI